MTPAGDDTPGTPAAESGRDRWLRLGLAGGLGLMTILHAAQPRTFAAMVPDVLPGDPAGWNALATVAEGVSALLLARRSTARAGGWLAAATIVGVFASNVDAAVGGGYQGLPAPLDSAAVAWARLPLQVPLVWWAVRVARASPH